MRTVTKPLYLTTLRGESFYYDTPKWTENGEDYKYYLCPEFVQGVMGRTPKTIRVSLSNERPHEKGWMRVQINRTWHFITLKEGSIYVGFHAKTMVRGLRNQR